MDSQRFDALTRRWGRGSRRQALAAFAAGLGGRVILAPDAEEAAAACKGPNAKCERNADCCAGDGLRCVKVGKSKKGKKRRKRCRCKSGTCPPQTPCCIGGKCQPYCADEVGTDLCCADCFVEILLNGNPDLDNPVCCQASGGTICGPKKKKQSDDRCCYPSESCVKGTCCCDGCKGATVCGGDECCAQDVCCNGKCCGDGKVCATTPDGPMCVSANRPCDECFEGEECHAGVCCPEERRCVNHIGVEKCCAVGEYCEQPGHPSGGCCDINTTCYGSYKGHRVRR